MKIKSVMTLPASLNSTCRARRKDGIVPTQGGHIKKKNPHCETGIMQNCRDSPNRREKPRSHFPVLFPPPDKPPTPVPLSRHTAPMCLLLGCLPPSRVWRPSLIVGGDKCHLVVSAADRSGLVAVNIPGGGEATMQL